MKPDPHQDHSALRWIRSELDETLRLARRNLEDFDEGDVDSLAECVEQLHRTHGSLEMVQVFGGAMLADEMERLASELDAGSVKRKSAACEVLMLGMVQLPAYLEKVESGEPDIPLVLLPLMNDLRAARDAPLVSEISLFAPKLDTVIANEVVVPGSGNPEMSMFVQQQRSHFHRGLLNWYRDIDAQLGLGQIRDVIESLSTQARTTRLRRLLDATEALVVALQEESIKSSIAIKLLFGKLDRFLKSVIDSGEEVAVREFPIELLKNQLYYIARSSSVNPVVESVRRSADLANSFPDLDNDGSQLSGLGGPGKELFAAVSDALRQDLNEIKDQLDLYIRGDRSDLDRLTALAAPIQRIGDTLGMVGRGELRSKLKRRYDQLHEIEQSGEGLDDDALMELASDLLFVESALSGLTHPQAGESAAANDDAVDEGGSEVLQTLSDGEFRGHVQAAVDEAFVELAKAKDAIVAYLKDPEAVEVLGSVPARLHAVSGALVVLGQAEAGQLLSELKPYIAALASGELAVPDQERRDALADLVTAVEYFMESVIDDRPNREEILVYARSALVRLGLVEPLEPVLADDAGVSDETTGSVLEPVEDGAVTEEITLEAVEPLAEPEEPVASAEKPALDDIDSEILDIFLEEAEEELAVVQQQYPRWRDRPEDTEALGTIRRSFHTLKGSGRMVGAKTIGEFAWSIENLLNRFIDGTTKSSKGFWELMDSAVEVLPALVGDLGSGVSSIDVSNLESRAFAFASADAAPLGEPEDAEHKAAEETGEKVSEETGKKAEDDETAATDIWSMDDSAAVDELSAVAESADVIRLVPGDAGAAGDIVEIVLDAPDENLDLSLDSSLDADVDAESDDDTLELELELDSEELLLDTLPLSGMQGESVDSLPVEDSTLNDGDLNEALRDTSELLLPAVGSDESPEHADEGGSPDLADKDTDKAAAAEAPEVLQPAAAIELDPTLHDIFRTEAATHLKTIDDFIDSCRGMPHGSVIGEDVRRALHTLRGSSHMAGVAPMAELAGSMEKWANLLDETGECTDASRLDLFERGHFVMNSLLSIINIPGESIPEWQSLQREVDQLALALTPMEEGSENEDEGPDTELVGIFLEEAHELLEKLEEDFSNWQHRPDDLLPVTQLQRSLHTIKGGARLAGISSLGDLSHAMESAFESIAEQRVESSPRLRELVRHALDLVASDIEALDQRGVQPEHPDMVEWLESAARGGDWADFAAEVISKDESLDVDGEIAVGEADSDLLDQSVGESALLSDSLLTDSELLDESSAVESSLLDSGVADDSQGQLLSEDSRIIQFPGRGRGDADESLLVRQPPAPDAEPEVTVSQERVRVRSELLDQMVNNAGEVGIYRSRLEQQNNELGFNLQELTQTIERLQTQLRNLELETEAQILSRHEREYEGERREDFDPLEMDRYSTIQQLSRGLSETVNDLGSIGDSLEDLSRDTDTLLAQQARVSNDLQDGLLRTRMVPFASRVARLQRVVRQTCNSVGKQAELTVRGGDGEMDRAILERMMGPLEHLLRNAVVHGIESPEERARSDKSEIGKISLYMAREGADVVLTVSDDGAGLDRANIREKAIERGLLDVDADIDDDDLDQFILEAGLSTAAEVSQIAGRGVGMDVVLTEVKQLGGSLEITSQPGSGSSFSIRLPFTLAITEALLLRNGDDVYAVPHSSMDGVVRISRDDLVDVYEGDRTTFEYDGRSYNVRYLGYMLGTGKPPMPEGQRWFPLLLVRSGEHRVAVHVDSLLGNRQIVVKPVGTQLSSVRWFTGGTILADGRIALILDMSSLVRIDVAQHVAMKPSDESADPKGVTVMVVDDSITVRKVTSRLLASHNMHVVTAKDGVDAVAVLQEQKPDVMLLDIEMPRMDGFELARHIRSTEAIRDIPIIMITSRSGEKHRKHAMDLGVKRYLGKPYQEADLLENIYTVLAEVDE